MRKKDNVNTIRTGSGATETKAGPGTAVLRFATTKNCFTKDTSLNDLEIEHELETVLLLTR